MERTDPIRLHATPHPSVEVRRAGFPLDHPYLEHCWTPLLGPTSVVLPRRIPQLWRDQDLTAELSAGELAASIGLGRSTGRSGPLSRTFERLARFRFAEVAGPGEFNVFTEVPPVRDRQLERLPAWNRQRHDDLLGVHLDHLAASHRRPPSPSDVSARLDAMATVHADTRPVPTLHR
jgi:hypothetical protein